MQGMYPSKVLLVGEYTVLMGQPGLAIPYSNRFGEWAQDPSIPDELLMRFSQYIGKDIQLNNIIDYEAFRAFIFQGGYLKTNIPFGYGLGSSGSLCAAVLDRFSTIETKNVELVYKTLKEMEHFFHGKSSGLDPIVAYYKQSVLFENGAVHLLPNIDSIIFKRYDLFLIDSSIGRNTQQMVKIFHRLCQNQEYLINIETGLMPANKNLITALQEGHDDNFRKHWRDISYLSSSIFKDMIPENVLTYWKEGLSSGAYYCKLCGAGGGGLFLVQVIDPVEFKKQNEKYQLSVFE